MIYTDTYYFRSLAKEHSIWIYNSQLLQVDVVKTFLAVAGRYMLSDSLPLVKDLPSPQGRWELVEVIGEYVCVCEYEMSECT